MSNATTGETPTENTPTTKDERCQISQRNELWSSSSNVLSQRSSPSSSLSGSQDSQQLHCSESMLSSTQSSSDSQLISELASQGIRENMSSPRNEISSGANSQLHSKQGDHGSEVLTGSVNSLKTSAPAVSNGCDTSQGRTPEEKSARSIATIVNSSVMSSNLSQLAELAASQAPSQISQYGPVALSHLQPLANHVPITAGHRFVVPGQSIPFPLGHQLSQAPPGYGTYQQGPVMQGQGHPGIIPPPFVKGSIIQLTSGELKRVEDLTTEDFVHSTSLCPDLKLETSTVVSVRKNDEVGMALIGFSINSTKAQVTLSCAVEHPFFVYGQGWSSCIPDQSSKKYNLQCHSLKVGDFCIFLSPNLAPIITIPGLPPGQVIPGNGIFPPGTQLISIPDQVAHTTSTQVVTGNPPGIVGNSGQAVVIKQGGVSSMGITTGQTSAQVLPSAAPSTTFTVIDPQIPGQQVGFFRPQHLPGQTFINQQVVGTVVDGKTVTPSVIPVQGPLPPYYQSVPASFVAPMPTQTFVQSSGVPGQASVGNGLLVTAVGFLPGQPGVQMGQHGMLYAAQLSEMAQKQGHDKSETIQIAVVHQEGQADDKADTGPPDAKRSKGDVNIEGK